MTVKVAKKQKVAKSPTKLSLRKEFLKANKLWRIWKIALTDLKLAEETCDIDMSYWCAPPKNEKGKCIVCAAGSVIYRRFNIKQFGHEREIVSTDFCENVFLKLEAINHLRHGDVSSAYQALYENYHSNEFPSKWGMPSYYYEGQEKFFEKANELLDYLKGENI